MTVLIDTNILVDMLDERSPWTGWSTRAVAMAGATRTLIINPIIYAEVSVGYDDADLLDLILSPFEREDIPWPSAYLAGKAFLRYRRAGGLRSSPLPDFFIGAHAQEKGYAVMTRDAARYRTYFPRVQLITPDTDA